MRAIITVTESRSMPDASKHDPRPEYLRALLADAGLTQRAAANLLGIDPRTMRYYLAPDDAKRRASAPYCVQYALEQLASHVSPTR